jgi:hypothetical protein
MLNKARISAALLVGTGCLLAGPLYATNFKCQDDKGVWHYGDTLPPECFQKPSQTIGKTGVLGKKTEGQLTPEELKARAAEQKTKKEEQQRALEIQRKNNALLTTYTSAQEIDIAREKNLKQAEDTIRGIQLKITDTQAQQVELQKEASSYKGKKLPLSLQKSIDDTDKDMYNNQQLIVSKRKELDAIRAKFDEEKRAYLELTGGTDSGTATDGKNK